MHEQRFILAHKSAELDRAVKACVQDGQLNLCFPANHLSGAVVHFKSQNSFIHFNSRDSLNPSLIIRLEKTN